VQPEFIGCSSTSCACGTRVSIYTVTQWPYSSFHRYVREDVLSPEWEGADLDGEYGELID